MSLRLNAPVNFKLIAVNLDQKQPRFPAEVLPTYLAEFGIPFHIIEQDTYSVVKRVIPQGKTFCGLCSRLRRGALYTFAERHDIDKIALGHHREDILETFFLNIFYGGKLKAMPAKLLSDDGRHIVIRPLAYCREKDIAAYAKLRAFPIIPLESLFSALQRVSTSHLLDPALFDFAGISRHRGDGSTAENLWLAGAYDENLSEAPSAHLQDILR